MDTVRPVRGARNIATALLALASCAPGATPAETDLTPRDTPPLVSAPIPVQERRLELSGAAVVEGGVLVVEDELIGTVLLLGALDRQPLVAATVKLERKKKARAPFADAFKLFPFQDFEDIASDGHSEVYLLGSHHGKGGERRPDREFLLQAEWDAKAQELKVVGEQYGLLALVAPVLEDFGSGIGLTATAVSDAFNLEGLALHAGTLYLGLRSPRSAAGKALILHAPAKALMSGTASLKAVELDLHGGGIRALDWDPVRNTLLVLSGAPGEDAGGASALWACDPVSGAIEPVVAFDEAIARKNPEGVCRLPDSTGGMLLVVLDGEEGASGAELVQVDW